MWRVHLFHSRSRFPVFWNPLIPAFLTLCLWAGRDQDPVPESERYREASHEIEITQPPGRGGGPLERDTIAGVARGPDLAHCRVVVYALTNRWYVQPLA